MKKLLTALIISVVLWTACSFHPSSSFPLKNSVVEITNTGALFAGGTGFELELPNGHIVTITNKHVCELKDEHGYVNVGSDEMSRPIPRRVLEEASDTDLCIIEGVPNLPALKMGKGDPLVGDHLFVIGHPLLQPDTETGAVFIGYADVLNVMHGYLLAMVCLPGNSGSPLFNSSEQVIGVIFAGSNQNQGVAVSLSDLQKFVAPY